jgi:hypothetical protein
MSGDWPVDPAMMVFNSLFRPALVSERTEQVSGPDLFLKA